MVILRFFLVMLLMGWGSSALATDVKTEKSLDGWRLLVDGKPFFIKGVSYTPTTMGECPDAGTIRNWMRVDDDHDGRNDFAYQSWVDTNLNNQKDPDEKEIGDFKLMHQMGVNAIRVYHHLSLDPKLQRINTHNARIHNYGSDFTPHDEQVLLRDMYSKYGIMVAMGDLLGAYTVSTGATWEKGTDYTNAKQRANMLRSVEEMVNRYKHEPFLLMWVLGNENNYNFTHTNAYENPEAYVKFVNEAAQLIKKLDGRHPVAISNGDVFFLEYYAKYTPDVDVFGLNKYVVGGFYELWKKVSVVYDRPVMLTEFGQEKLFFNNGSLNEDVQAKIHGLSWEDIARHAGGKQAPANAIGGFVYSWVDDWAKDGDPYRQNLNMDRNGWDHEYSGIVSMGNGNAGSLARQLRKLYWLYKDLWGKDKE